MSVTIGICALLVAIIIILLIVVVKFYLDIKRYRSNNSVVQVMRISSMIEESIDRKFLGSGTKKPASTRTRSIESGRQHI